MQLCVYKGIRFANLSEYHRQFPFLESMSLHHVLCQLVLIKENKTKVLTAWRVAGPSKHEHNILFVIKITITSIVIGLENTYFPLIDLQVVIGQFFIGQFVIAQFSKPITFKVVVWINQSHLKL